MERLKGTTGIALLVIGLMLTVSLFAQTGTLNEQGATSSNSAADSGQETSTQGEPIVLVDPAKIYNESPMSWVGKSVVLKNVTVEDTNDSGNFWIGSDNNHRLLVVKKENNDNLRAITVHKGDVITVAGQVQAASRYKASQTTASSGSMHDAEKSSGVFLLADQLHVDSSTHQ
jgi:hypothetical protein